MISKMNADFHAYVAKGMSINSAYECMVNNNPYKVLADYSYDWNEQPLDSSAVENVPDTSDVSFFIHS